MKPVDIIERLSYIGLLRAGIAQLVEYKLPKLGVASSNLVARSTQKSGISSEPNLVK